MKICIVSMLSLAAQILDWIRVKAKFQVSNWLVPCMSSSGLLSTRVLRVETTARFDTLVSDEYYPPRPMVLYSEVGALDFENAIELFLDRSSQKQGIFS